MRRAGIASAILAADIQGTGSKAIMEVRELAINTVNAYQRSSLKVIVLGVTISAFLTGQIVPPGKDKPIPGLALTLEASQPVYAAGERIQRCRRENSTED